MTTSRSRSVRQAPVPGRTYPRLIAATLATILLSSAASLAAGGTDEAAFESFLKPLLAEHCVKCHGGEKTKGKVNLKEISTSGHLLAKPKLLKVKKPTDSIGELTCSGITKKIVRKPELSNKRTRIQANSQTFCSNGVDYVIGKQELLQLARALEESKILEEIIGTSRGRAKTKRKKKAITSRSG